jgi:hypothetical protein
VHRYVSAFDFRYSNRARLGIDGTDAPTLRSETRRQALDLSNGLSLKAGPKGQQQMPKAWEDMTVEEKLEELHRGKQSVVLGLARIIEEMCDVVKRLDDEFAEFRRQLTPPAEEPSEKNFHFGERHEADAQHD